MREIILTGGSGGIGRAIAKELSKKEFKILNLDLQPPAAILENEEYRMIDLADEDNVARLAGSLFTNNLYGVVHCAGYGGPYQLLTEVSMADYHRIIGTNLTSIVLLLQQALPVMARNRFGRTVFVSSMLGHVGAARSTIYSASKHAVNGLMKSLTDEWGGNGLTFNSVSPGFVQTAMGVREDQVTDHLQKVISRTPVGRTALPEEIARVVAFLLDEQSGYISGADWAVDGGMTAV